VHNALRQIQLNIPNNHLQGFSISGLSTYIQMPEIDICFDMGECPLSALKLNHVFLSHSHGDHSRCLMRHYSLRKMMGIEKPAVYYMPDEIVEPFKNLVKAEAIFEGVREDRLIYPIIYGLSEQEAPIQLEYRKNLMIQGFPVVHRVPSQGCTIYDYKKKLKSEFHGLPPAELIHLRNTGTTLETPVKTPRVTFIGDCIGDSLLDQSHIWDSPILILESTFLDPGEKEMAKAKGHTHIEEIAHALREMKGQMKTQHLVLKHFSMKYSKDHVLRRVKESIPKFFIDNTLTLL
jgi:ribonuclease Z